MDNNPLRQYFRRPSVYLKLPSGGIGYKEGAIDIPENLEIPIYPMTAIDEITARTPDALFNGIAVAEIIKSCAPSIKDPWAIQSNDLDAILIAIKAASGGEDLSLDSMCPNCGEQSSYGMNLVGMLSTLSSGDYNIPYEIRDLKIKFRPLVYKEMNEASMLQFDLQKMFNQIENTEDVEQKDKLGKEALEKITLLTMELITKSIEYIQTPTVVVSEPEFIVDFLKNCDRNIYNSIRDYNAELKAKAELKPMDLTCPECSHSYQQKYTLDPSDFFG